MRKVDGCGAPTPASGAGPPPAGGALSRKVFRQVGHVRRPEITPVPQRFGILRGAVDDIRRETDEER
ncbi:hypothetical protein GCM10023075_24480 [Streptosporangium album]